MIACTGNMHPIDKILSGNSAKHVVESALTDNESVDTIISVQEMVEFAYIDLYASLSLLHSQLNESKHESFSLCMQELEDLKRRIDRLR